MKRKTKRKKTSALSNVNFDPRLRYCIPTGARLLSVSSSWTWAKIARGDILVIRDGARTFIPGSEIERLSRVPRGAVIA